MPPIFACLAGGPLRRALEAGGLKAQLVDAPDTPFGESESILRVSNGPAPFYVVPRELPGRKRRAPAAVNYRATLYALKDLGVGCVLCWSAAGAITHTRQPGEVIVPGDVLDMTYRRRATFFEKSGLGRLRQFPVFCPTLIKALSAALEGLGFPTYTGGTAAVTEGPRYETPAEVRMLGNVGAELVTHTLVPEVFLAKELQMCFAGACYLVSYAETGSAHRPFSTGALFGGLTHATAGERVARVKDGLTDILFALLERLKSTEGDCRCDRTMAEAVAKAGLGDDWHTWFD